MNALDIFLLINGFYTFYMGVIWKKLGWLNLSFKIIFFICSFASAFFLMKNMGYIIQIP